MQRRMILVQDEEGAITVDWVVLCAALVGLAIVIMTSVGGGTRDLSDEVSSVLSGMSVSTY